MQHPDWRQQRSGTCCLAAKKATLAAEGESRPRDPQSAERPLQGSRGPWDNHHSPASIRWGRAQGTARRHLRPWPQAHALPLTVPHCKPTEQRILELNTHICNSSASGRRKEGNLQQAESCQTSLRSACHEPPVGSSPAQTWCHHCGNRHGVFWWLTCARLSLTTQNYV